MSAPETPRDIRVNLAWLAPAVAPFVLVIWARVFVWFCGFPMTEAARVGIAAYSMILGGLGGVLLAALLPENGVGWITIRLRRPARPGGGAR